MLKRIKITIKATAFLFSFDQIISLKLQDKFDKLQRVDKLQHQIQDPKIIFKQLNYRTVEDRYNLKIIK